MKTYLDLFLHALMSLLAGYLAWKATHAPKKRLIVSILWALAGGVLIDIDHFLDYFLTYGFGFNYDTFLYSSAFSRSGKSYILLHAFEYVLILGVLTALSRNAFKKMILGALCLSLLFHLLIDMLLFSVPAQAYFITYRATHNFSSAILDR